MDATREVAGVRFPDPYQWLEADTEEVAEWQKRQAQLAASYCRDWPHYPAVQALVESCTADRFGSLPRFAGGVWFRNVPPERGTFGQVVVSEDAYGEGRVLLDLADFQSEGRPVLSWLSPSPDGRVLAVGICTDGSEQNTIRLVDVDTGTSMAGVPAHLLHDGWTGGVTWLPDASGFFYQALRGSVHDFQRGVFLHRLGRPAPTAPEQIPGIEGQDYTLVQVSRCGRWAVAAHRIMNPIPTAVLDLHDPAARWRPFVTELDGTVAGHLLDDAYVAITDVGAPRGRLVRIPLNSPTPNDPSTWDDLVPESAVVLRDVRPVDGVLYLVGLEDTYATVRIYGEDGSSKGVVPLPGKGVVIDPGLPLMALVPQGHPDELLFAFSTLSSAWAVYRHRPGADSLEQLTEPAAALNDVIVEDHWATSADGTRVPYHSMRLTTADATRPLPTLVYAYGGFNHALVPQYPSAMAAFVAAGGVFVHAHLRGGGELGREWWEGGRMKNKQNSYDDLYAVAEDLIGRGVTSSEALAVTGSSNGGLMAAVAITQRPDLWRAAVPRVPTFDLIGALQDPYDVYATRAEFADPDDPEEIRRLAGISPYHQVADGERYPAVLIDAGATDPRCPPWQSRKFAARLQAAQAADAPVLLHVWDNAGHGMATDRNLALDQSAEWLAFLFKTLEMKP